MDRVVTAERLDSDLGTPQEISDSLADIHRALHHVAEGVIAAKAVHVLGRAHRVEMPISDQGLASQKVPEPIVAGAAVARGRVYFVSSDERISRSTNSAQYCPATISSFG